MIISTWMCGGSIRSKCPDGPSVAFTRCTGSSVPIATSFSRYLVSFSIFTTWSGGNAVGDGHQHAPWCSSSLCSYSMRAGRGRLALRRCQLFPSFQYFWWIFHLCQRFFFLSLFFSFSLFLWWRIFKCRFYEFISCCWVELNFRAGLPNWFGFPFFPFFFCFFAGLILANYFNGSLANSREAISSVVRLVLNRICIFKLPLRLQIVTRHYRALEWYINQSRYARIRWSVLMTGWRAVVAPLPPPPSSGGGRSFPSFFLPPPSLLAPLIPPCPPPRHWRLEGAICRPWRGWFIDWSNAMLIRVFPSIFELATSEQLEIPFACSFLFSPSLPPPPPR